MVELLKHKTMKSTKFDFGYREKVSEAPDTRDDWGRWTVQVCTYTKCGLDTPGCMTVEELAEEWAEIAQDGEDWLAFFGEGREQIELVA